MHFLTQASTRTTLLYDATPLPQHVTNASPPRCIDIGGSGLQVIPDVIVQSMLNADELRAGQNQLQTIGLRTIAELHALRVLRLSGNGFTEFPEPLLAMQGLRVLDLSDNAIGVLPSDVCRLERSVHSHYYFIRNGNNRESVCAECVYMLQINVTRAINCVRLK